MARVLVVDDTLSVRALLRLMLERGGHVVVAEAEDGAEGVALAGETDPDAVVLDFEMPRMNGVEALPLIRQAAPRASVVMFSSAEQARSAPVDAYIDKLDGVDAVLDALDRLTTASRNG